MLRLKLWVIRKMNTLQGQGSMSVNICHESGVNTIANVDLAHLAGGFFCWALPLQHDTPPFSSMPCTLETRGSVRFTLQEWEWYPLPWGWSSYANNSEFFCMKSLSLYLYLLIYSITYLYQYVSWMFMLYLLNYNSKLLYVFWLFQF